jgi:AAA+ ATPase superfamily predicted ATPase
VAGNPVEGELFVGREDILQRLEELWSGEGQCSSVVLYGHRRMGKSSILRNLGARFGAHKTIVDFNMQRVGLVSSTGELLYNLVLALSDSLSSPGAAHLAEPDEARFLEHNPYTAFDRYLKQLDQERDTSASSSPWMSLS